MESSGIVAFTEQNGRRIQQSGKQGEASEGEGIPGKHNIAGDK